MWKARVSLEPWQPWLPSFQNVYFHLPRSVHVYCEPYVVKSYCGMHICLVFLRSVCFVSRPAPRIAITLVICCCLWSMPRRLISMPCIIACIHAHLMTFLSTRSGNVFMILMMTAPLTSSLLLARLVQSNGIEIAGVAVL